MSEFDIGFSGSWFFISASSSCMNWSLSTLDEPLAAAAGVLVVIGVMFIVSS
jgi:hypothetical protein